MRLHPEHLSALPPHVQCASANAARAGIGNVQLGIGSFHHAHLTVFTDDAMLPTIS